MTHNGLGSWVAISTTPLGLSKWYTVNGGRLRLAPNNYTRLELRRSTLRVTDAHPSRLAQVESGGIRRDQAIPCG